MKFLRIMILILTLVSISAKAAESASVEVTQGAEIPAGSYRASRVLDSIKTVELLKNECLVVHYLDASRGLFCGEKAVRLNNSLAAKQFENWGVKPILLESTVGTLRNFSSCLFGASFLPRYLIFESIDEIKNLLKTVATVCGRNGEIEFVLNQVIYTKFRQRSAPSIPDVSDVLSRGLVPDEAYNSSGSRID
jgi:hypothetical protein